MRRMDTVTLISFLFLAGLTVQCTDPISGLVKESAISVKIGEIDLPSGGSHDFGSIPADGAGGSASNPVTFTIGNSGNSDLVISNIALTSGNVGDFSLTPSYSSPVGSGDSTSFIVTFDPSSQGYLSATVSIGNNDKKKNPYVFTVSGVGSSQGTVATPSFNPQGGTYTSAQNVYISCNTTESTIYFTLDQNDPSTDSIQYTGPVSVSETLTIKAIAVRQGWENSAIATAVYTILDTYQVVFDPDGGSGIMSPQSIVFGNAENLKLNTFTMAGYSFAGWATSAGGSVVYADGASYTMATEGATLYARWSANNYNVSFDPNGGSGSMNPQSITFGTSANLNANSFTRTGHSFAGWATSSGGPVSYANGALYSLTTEGATLYAKWSANNYNVSFHSNGGSGSMNPQSITFGTSANLNANSFTLTGYSFTGWATSSGGPVSYANGALYSMTTEGATLYAKWSANSYNVSFDPNGGSGSMNPQSITFGASANLNANTFTLTGYSFTGWATSSGGSVAYADSAAFTMSTEGATLWAKWTIEQYTVTFDSQGGTSVLPQTIDYNGLVTAPSNPAKTYFIFSGWHKDAGCTIPWVFSTDRVIANTVLYAGWADQYSPRSTGPAGGLIFYLNPSYQTDGWRYLEAAPTDQSAGCVWDPSATVATGATLDTIGSGLGNTDAICINLGAGTYAARLCYDLTIASFSDWFLPSRAELAVMYANLKAFAVGGLSDARYWASVESDSMYAHNYYMQFPGENGSSYKLNSFRVRAARRF